MRRWLRPLPDTDYRLAMKLRAGDTEDFWRRSGSSESILADRRSTIRTASGRHFIFPTESSATVQEAVSRRSPAAELRFADNTIVILGGANGPETTGVVHMRADPAHDGAKPWRGVKGEGGGGQVFTHDRIPKTFRMVTTV